MLTQFRAPDVLKIDVEGAELEVLRGAAAILGQPRPIIYCEVSALTRADVTRLLESCAYGLWDGCGFDGSLNSPRMSPATSNLVAIPQEKIEMFLRRND
jgi:hypothetical protein